MSDSALEGPPASLQWQYLLWFGITVTILSAGYAYLGMRLILPFHWTAAQSLAAWGVLLLFIVLPVVSMALLRVSERLSHATSWGAYTALGFLSFVFTLTVARDALLLVLDGTTAAGTLFGWIDGGLDAAWNRQDLVRTSNVAVLAMAVMTTAAAIVLARRTPRVARYTLPFRTLPAGFDGFRIVQISDLHAGLTIGREWIASVVRQVQELKPDLIAFTGDIADGSVDHLREVVAPLAGLEAPYGKFFVTGNHEYYSGAYAWVAHVRTLGFTVLMNEHTIVSRNGSSLVMAGVTDLSAGQFAATHRSDPAASVAQVPGDSFKVLLAHQPRSYYAAEPLGFHLILHGHTHGGQFFPWNLVAGIGQPFLKGLHRRRESWIYVSTGTGYWGPPMRLGAPPEIAELTLKKDDGGE